MLNEVLWSFDFLGNTRLLVCCDAADKLSVRRMIEAYRSLYEAALAAERI